MRGEMRLSYRLDNRPIAAAARQFDYPRLSDRVSDEVTLHG